MQICLHPTVRRAWGSQKEYILKYFLFTFFVCCFAYFSLFRTAYYNFDDQIRLFSNRLIDEGVHGRVLADFLIRAFYDGVYYDTSPATQIGALFLFILTGFILFFKITANFPKNLVHCAFLLPALLSPYVFFILSFRFDSILMGIAAALSVLPFILYSQTLIVYSLVASIPLLGVLCLYQPMHNFYLCAAIFFGLMKIASRARFSACLAYSLRLLFPYGISLLLYIPIFQFAKNNAISKLTALEGTCNYVLQHTQIGGPLSIVLNLMKNIQQYFSVLKSDLQGMQFGFFLLMVTATCFTLLVLRMLATHKKSCAKLGWKVPVFVLLFGTWLVAPFGIMLGLQEPTWDGRIFVSLFAFVVCGLAFISKSLTKSKGLYTLATIYIVYTTISCTLLISSIGNAFTAQNEYNLHYKNLLIEDMYTLKTKYNISNIASLGGIGQAPATKRLFIQYPLFNRSVNSIGDMTGFIFYSPLRYANMHYLHPFTPDTSKLTKENILIERSAYTIFRLNDNSCMVVFREPESYKRIDKWFGAGAQNPTGVAH